MGQMCFAGDGGTGEAQAGERGRLGRRWAGEVGTEQSTKNSPDHIRTDPAARGGELLSHAARK